MFIMKIEEMTITQIEEFIRDKFPETNLYIRCLECDEYYTLSEMNLELEICQDCQESNNDIDDNE